LERREYILRSARAPLILNVEKEVFYKTIYSGKKKLDQPQGIDIVETLVLTSEQSINKKTHYH